ncbi:MAG: AI-2E family transporter [Pseudomonadota bacterium]
MQAPEPTDQSTETPERKPRLLALKLPVHVRNVPTILIATFVVLYFLQWAKPFLVPLFVGVLISYALSPVVNWVERIHIPRPIAAVAVLIAFIAPTVMLVYFMADDAVELAETLPLSIKKVATAVRGDGSGAVSKIQQAAKELEEVAQGEPTKPARQTTRVTTVQVEPSAMKITDYLWSGSKTALIGVGEALMVIFLVMFLLISGDMFKRKLVKVIGDTLSEKKITVQILDEIDIQIQRYMLVLLVSNVLLGIATWWTLMALGVAQAGAWGVAAGFLHVIPYFGPFVTAAATALAGFLQFGTLTMAFTVAGSTLIISSLIGIVLVTWLTGRASHMNSASVFIGLLFWGWIWGLWGLLLGIPIMVIVKVVSDHIDGLAPISELLGE